MTPPSGPLPALPNPARIGDIYHLWDESDLYLITGPLEVFRSPIGWCARYPALIYDERPEAELEGRPRLFTHTAPLWCFDPENGGTAALVSAADGWSCWPLLDEGPGPRAIPMPRR